MHQTVEKTAVAYVTRPNDTNTEWHLLKKVLNLRFVVTSVRVSGKVCDAWSRDGCCLQRQLRARGWPVLLKFVQS